MRSFLLSVATLLCIQLANAQPTTVGLVAYWKMDGNFNDAGPYGIHGTNYGATATTNIAAIPNKAMLFLNPSSAVAQYATHPVNANVNFSGTQDFTIAFYVFANSPYVHTGGFYDNNLNYGGPGIWFWNSPGVPTVQFNYRNASLASVPGTFPIGQWVHVCCMKAGGVTRMYINGMLNNTGTVGTMVPTYSYPARFGTMFYASYPHYNGFNGKLNELRIYNRALTALEVIKVLPVQLSSFTAANSNNNIKLQWKTEFEQNTKHYNIQRSMDGVNFTDVNKVNATGNSGTPLTYSYTDALPPILQTQPVMYYRIQSFDMEERFWNSQVVAVNLDMKDVKLLVFPNPAKEALQVQTNAITGQATLSVTDAAGKIVYTRDIILETGTNSMPLNIISLSKGVYFLRLTNGKDNFVKQFVKE